MDILWVTTLKKSPSLMRILVIEDEPGIARFLKDGLEQERFAVDFAHDGRTGLEMALCKEYDLLIVDWTIPGLSGIELCLQFRSENKATPLLFLTAKDTIDNKVFGLGDGAIDYIRKPFAFEELMARIEAHLRKSPVPAFLLESGAVTLDLGTHRVFCGKNKIDLSPQEFSLLEYLLHNKASVCTRSRIIEHVWDIRFDTNTAVIDVYINHLRKKLNAAGCSGLIETVREIGYAIARTQPGVSDAE